MKICVIGASGFLGRALCERLGVEHEVVGVCRRPGSIDGLVAGDILDPSSLAGPLEGCDAVVHAAGAVSHRPEDAAWLYEVHVTGTENALAAAKAAGVRRFVHVSSSGTVAVSRSERVLDEEAPEPLEIVKGWPYYRSKLFAEQTALAANSEDFEVVVVNPTLLLGPGDSEGGSVKSVRLMLEGQIPALPSGGISFVDVRDAADGIARALEQGRAGARYLLGATNLSFASYYERIARASGTEPPRWKVPKQSRKVLGFLPSGVRSRIADRFGVDRVELEMASHFWYLDSTRARSELGWEPRDPTETLRDTVDDLVARGAGAPDALL